MTAPAPVDIPYSGDTPEGTPFYGVKGNYDSEVADEEEERYDISLYKYEYYAWGAIHFAMVVTGVLIRSWYNGLVTTNPWFMIQCPATAYTAVTGAVSPLSLYTGSATTTAVAPNGWTKDLCL